jgi:hypothetical protein
MESREEKTKPAFFEKTVRTGTGAFDLEAGIRRIGDETLVDLILEALLVPPSRHEDSR